MDALQQRVEIEPVLAGVGHDDLAVDDAAFGQGLAQRIEQFREVARQRPEFATEQLEPLTLAEHDAAEAVPLRLVQPAIAVGNRPRQLGQHRFDRRLQRQVERFVGGFGIGIGIGSHRSIIADRTGPTSPVGGLLHSVDVR